MTTWVTNFSGRALVGILNEVDKIMVLQSWHFTNCCITTLHCLLQKMRPLKPSTSSHSKPHTIASARLLKCLVLQRSVIKTKHSRVVGIIQGFKWLEILGLSCNQRFGFIVTHRNSIVNIYFAYISTSNNTALQLYLTIHLFLLYLYWRVDFDKLNSVVVGWT